MLKNVNALLKKAIDLAFHLATNLAETQLMLAYVKFAIVELIGCCLAVQVDS